MPGIPDSPGTCPHDIAETAKEYALERLSIADALQFATHCLTCRPCAGAAEEAKSLVRAVRGLAGQFRAQPAAAGWQWSEAPLPPFTPKRLVGASAQMQFYVTGYEPPRR